MSSGARDDTEIAPSLGRPDDRVIYLGDWDLAGNQIEANTRHVLDEGGELQWERLALTKQQVHEHGLPIITKHDRRYKNGGSEHQAVETEASSQRVLIERLDELLPEPLVRVQEREARQRRAVRKRIETFCARSPTPRGQRRKRKVEATQPES
jgi:hypothetical protein